MGGDSIDNGGDNTQQQKGAEDRKIFVGGIACDVTNEDLQQHFSQFGEVTQAQVKIDRTTGRSRGFAFVEFATAEACKSALTNREQNIKSKPCEVKPAKSRENKKVFVGGLPAELPGGPDELRKHFEQFGKVDDIEWPIDKDTKYRRNFAFIVFEEVEAADRAAATGKAAFGDREVDVKKAVPQNRRFNNFRSPMSGPRGVYGGGMRPQMPVHNAGPWYNGWNQMGGVYGNPAQGAPAGTGGWGDWYSGNGYFAQGAAGQQNPAAPSYAGYGGNTPNYGGAAGYDYSQNGSNAARPQAQNGGMPQRQGYQQSQY